MSSEVIRYRRKMLTFSWPSAIMSATGTSACQCVETKFSGQNGQRPNVVKVAIRRSLRRAAWKTVLSRRSGLPRKTASFFMRSTNFLKFALAVTTSSDARRRCRSIRWTPMAIHDRKESAQAGSISSVSAVSRAVCQNESSNVLRFKYDGLCIVCSLLRF